ncbi:DUF2515 family protein [Herbaspirillum seropedicae]|uniref:DUF2515 family protein n=1 Tax=Herbaspirillum seropedicae TaxID=964 RepID=UPI0035B521A1
MEGVESRMMWIKRAADSFHSLMQQKPDYMEAGLRTMAGRVTMDDSESPVLKAPQIYRL